MKYGQIAGNTHINATIYRCFEFLTESDARRFARRFREQEQDNQQVMHTFRELVVGGYLGATGLRVRNELPLDGNTPDWSIVDDQAVPRALVELVNFHLPVALEREIASHTGAGTVWVGRLPDNDERLCDRIHTKILTYKDLVARLGIPYVVAVFGEFTATVDIAEVRYCVDDDGAGLFREYPHASGVLFFEEQSGRYAFRYLSNHHALHPFGIRDGTF